MADITIELERITNPARLAYLVHWSVPNEGAAHTLAEIIRHNLEMALRSQGWKEETVKRMLANIHISANPYGVRVVSTDKILNYLELGTRPRKMSYLLNKTVPIKVPWGVIFRKVTPMSLMRGGWRHPGTEPRKIIYNVVRDGVRYISGAIETIEQLATRLRDLVG